MSAIRAKIGIQHFVLDPQLRTLTRGSDANHALVWVERQFDARDHDMSAGQSSLRAPVEQPQAEHDLDNLSLLEYLCAQAE